MHPGPGKLFAAVGKPLRLRFDSVAMEARAPEKPEVANDEKEVTKWRRDKREILRACVSAVSTQILRLLLPYAPSSSPTL